MTEFNPAGHSDRGIGGKIRAEALFPALTDTQENWIDMLEASLLPHVCEAVLYFQSHNSNHPTPRQRDKVEVP